MKNSAHLKKRTSAIHPEESPTSWRWLELFVETMEAAAAAATDGNNQAWPHLSDFTTSVIWMSKNIGALPLGSWDAYQAAVDAGTIDPNHPPPGVGEDRHVPEPHWSLMPRMVAAMSRPFVR